MPGEAAEAAEQSSILEGHGRALMQTDATFRQQPDLLPCFQCRIQRQIQPLWVISRKLNYISGVPACPHSCGTALPANNQLHPHLPPKHGARTAFLLQWPADKTRAGTRGINIYMNTTSCDQLAAHQADRSNRTQFR